MKALDLYYCSFSKFAKPFRDNETIYNQARDFWNQLDNAAWGTLGITLLVGVGFAICYYTVFNNKPGRHYKPKYWWLFMLLTCLTVLVSSIVLELCMAKPRLEGAFIVELKVAIISAIYTLFPYLLVSFVWCNFFRTNAYRYLKISK